MPRKGKFGKKPGTGGVLKGDDVKNKEVALKDEKSKGKVLPRKGPGHGEAGKKQASIDLGGLIFMCSGSTKSDCFKYRVFGLNEGKKNLVEQVRKGMRLFLFDIELRLLYGIYVAASNGSYKLERDAFGGAFPWQVRFSIQKDCLPLPEDVYQAAIKDNYLDKKKFKVELTTEQVHKLVKLFRPLPANIGRSPPRSRMSTLDKFEVAAKSKAPRYPDNDRYVQDALGAARLSPRTKYETHMSSDLARLPPRLSPRAKYETSYVSSDLGRLPPRLSPRAQFETSYLSSDLGRLPPRLSPRAKYETSYGLGHLPPPFSPRAKYESSYVSSDLGRLPPMSKYESGYTDSDRYRSERQIAGYPHSSTKYAQLNIPENGRIVDGRVSDDPYLGRELRLQQELTQHSQIGSGLLSSAPLSLSSYSADPLRSLSDLRQPRAREELYSLYAQGSTLSADVDSVHRQRLLVPDARAEALDRRVAGLDPLVDSSAAYNGGLSDAYETYPSSTGYERLLRESGAGFLSGRVTGASGLDYRGDLLPHSRYY